MDSLRMRHRHLIVLPAFLLLCAFLGTASLNVLQGDLTEQGVVSAGSEERRIDLPHGAVAVLFPGSTVFITNDTVRLTAGSLFLESAGISTVTLATYEVVFWGGAVHLSVQQENVSIAALSAPVYIRSSAGEETIVPAQRQWTNVRELLSSRSDIAAWLKSRTVQPLPERFVLDMQPYMKELSVVDEDQETFSYSLPTFSLLQLPLSQERSHHADLLLRLDQFADELDETNNLSRLLREDSVLQEALTLPEGKNIAAMYIARSDDASLQGALLPILLEDPVLSLLAHMHPRTRDLAWVLAEPQKKLLALFFLPLSDTLPEALSPLARERWKAMAEVIGMHDAEGVHLLSLLLEQMVSHLQSSTMQALPDRSTAYMHALRELLEPHEEETFVPQQLLLQEVRQHLWRGATL